MVALAFRIRTSQEGNCCLAVQVDEASEYQEPFLSGHFDFLTKTQMSSRHSESHVVRI